MIRTTLIALTMASLVSFPGPSFAFSNEELSTSYFMKDPTPLTQQEQDSVAASVRGRSMQSVKPITTPDGTVRFPFGLSRPIVVCAVLQVCAIELQAGEQITGDLQIGDPRFSLEPMLVGTGEAQVTHVIIKPFDVGLKTTLLIPTDRRIYNVELRSHLTEYMSKVGFFYPDEVKKRQEIVKQQEAAERKRHEFPRTGEYLGDLDFNYRIEGDAPWRPIRVYNDGKKTIIQMPSTIGQAEAPVFAVLRGGGWFSQPEKIVANYRVHGDRFIVDAIFDRGALFSGVGDNQRSVEILRGR